jgi:tetratricopeptide (TPR) repeat protein
LALLHGRIAFDWSQAARSPQVRDDVMDRAKAALDDAIALSPFDADHVANLGRWHLETASFEPERARRELELGAATRRFERALEMRPGALRWRRELASALERRGDLDGAIENLEVVHEILSTDVDLVLDLVGLQRARAIRTKASSDTEVARRSADEAVRLADLAVTLEPENLRARKALEASRSLLLFPDERLKTEIISHRGDETEAP